MTLEHLNLGPVFIGTVKTAAGDVLTDRKVVLAGGFVYVETPSHGQTEVVAYPGSRIEFISDLKPGPSEHLGFGV
jgi:hypothetical protein